MDDEGIPEIAQIHESPQKRHSSITGPAVAKNFQTENPFAKTENIKSLSNKDNKGKNTDS